MNNNQKLQGNTGNVLHQEKEKDDDPFYSLLFEQWLFPWKYSNCLDEDVKKADEQGLSYGWYMHSKRGKENEKQ
jgi:hypothetical protein